MTKMITKEEPESKNKLNGVLFLIRILFPWIELIRMNLLLSRINRFYNNSFFKMQKKKNMIISLITFFITYFPFLLGTLALKGNRAFNIRLSKAIDLLSNFEVSSAVKIFSLTFSDPVASTIIKTTFFIILPGLICSNLLIFGLNSIISDTNKFKKILKNEGIIRDEKDSGAVLFTPIGAFLDIAGSSAKEIQNNERIWLAMNIEVKDYAQNPEKRSELFFKSAFNLKSRYDYVFKK